MATNSIFKNITIRDKKLSRNLIAALENAKDKKGKDVEFRKKHGELSKDKIKDVFGVD